MRISKPRRELYKQSLRSLIAANPKSNNVVLSQQLGIHRNTIARLLTEIQKENETIMRDRWKMLLNDVTEIAQIRNAELNGLWVDSYHSLYHKSPTQLVAIVKTNWAILKDLYQLHLNFMGIQNTPNSLIQVNIGDT